MVDDGSDDDGTMSSRRPHVFLFRLIVLVCTTLIYLNKKVILDWVSDPS